MRMRNTITKLYVYIVSCKPRLNMYVLHKPYVVFSMCLYIVLHTRERVCYINIKFYG
jgi:hypothetical protein